MTEPTPDDMALDMAAEAGREAAQAEAGRALRLLDQCRDDWQAAAEEAQEQQDRAVEAEAERDKLQAFKTWVHGYLDAQGVPHHPPGPHGAEGCRIGDRLDWWRDRLLVAEAERDRLRAMVRGLSDRVAAQSELLRRRAERPAMAEPRWTTRPPAQEGWYWWRTDRGDCPVVVRVLAEPWGEARAWSGGYSEALADLGGDWAGPLAPPPDEAVQAEPPSP